MTEGYLMLDARTSQVHNAVSDDDFDPFVRILVFGAPFCSSALRTSCMFSLDTSFLHSLF